MSNDSFTSVFGAGTGAMHPASGGMPSFSGGGGNTATEVEQLSSNLSSQIEYNNTLLQQLQSLEQAQLASQQGSQDRQLAFRKQHADLTATKDENARLTVENGHLNKTVAQLRDESTNLSTEIRSYSRKLEEAGRELSKLRDDLNRANEERSSLIAKNDVLSRQIGTLESSNHSLHSDAHARLTDLQLGRDQAVKESQQLSVQNSGLANEIQALQHNLQSSQASLDSALHNLSNERTKTMQLEQRLASLETEQNNLMHNDLRNEEKNRQFEKFLAEKREEINKISAENKMLTQRITHLERERDDLNVRLTSEHAISNEKEQELLRYRNLQSANETNFHAQVTSLQEREGALKRDVESEREERRNVTREWENKYQQLRESESNERRRIEEQAQILLHNVNAQLTQARNEGEHVSNLLRAAQREKAEVLSAWNSEREQHEQRFRDKMHTHENEANHWANREKELIAAFNSNVSKYDALLNISNERGEQATHVLSLTHEELHHLARHISDQESTIKSVVSELNTCRNVLHGFMADVHAQSETEQRELSSLLQQLMDMSRANVKLSDALRLSEISAEEERALRLTAEEELSRAQTQVHEHSLRANQAEERSLEAHRATLDASNRENTELRAELRERNRQIEECSVQLNMGAAARRALQEDNAALTRQLSDVQSKWSARVSQMEEQLTTQNKQLAALSNERDASSNERNVAQHTLQNMHRESTSTISRLQGEVRALTSKLKEIESEKTEGTSALKGQVHSLTESLKKFQQQLAQTQSLLLVVQEQRKNLQSDNAALRQELDGLYRGQRDGTQAIQKAQTLQAEVEALQRQIRILEDRKV
jgi:chromosome segregation ATPase